MTTLDNSIATNLSDQTPQPIMILVNPQMGENIGAAARAMLNCGLFHLRLVAPRDGWPNERAISMSSGALAMMPPVAVFSTLQDAIADCQHVIATTGLRRDIVKPVHTADSAMQLAYKCVNDGKKVAILFGCERVGLGNDEIALAHDLVTFATNPDFSSLNLAQAVMVMAYEWSKHAITCTPCTIPTGRSDFATSESFELFFKRLDTALIETGFYRVPEMKNTMSRNIRTVLMRATPTEQEINTLHGVLTSILNGKNR